MGYAEMGDIELIIVWVGLAAISLLPAYLSGYLTRRYLRKRWLAADAINLFANVVILAVTVGGAVVWTYAREIGMGLVRLAFFALSAALVGKIGGTYLGTRVAKTLAERKRQPPTT